MPTSFAGQLSIALQAQMNNILDVGRSEYPVNYSFSDAFTDGAGADQASKIFTDTRTIAISGTDDLDLNGVLIDPFGVALALTKIKVLIVRASRNNVNDVVVGGAASAQVASIFNAVTEKIKVKPGGTLCLIAPDAAGYAVTATSADLLRIANGGAGTSVEYTIAIVGA
jgi:hypothetical protein